MTGPNQSVSALLSLVVGLAACGGSGEASTSGIGTNVSPEDRSVLIETTACGDASKTTGSGVIVENDLVLTVAHVVIGADSVFVSGSDSRSVDSDERVTGAVVVLDTINDLALVRVPTAPLVGSVDDIALADFSGGDSATIHAARTPGVVPVEVLRRARISVDEVRGPNVVEREGYELAGEIDGGDSGAGVFDHRGALGAIVFAEPSTPEAGDLRAFAVAVPPIDELSDGLEQSYSCDASMSRLIVDELR